jgi:hypothetical protein
LKRYVITTGSYGDYHIYCHLEGPDGADITGLFDQFHQTFGIPKRTDYDKRRRGSQQPQKDFYKAQAESRWRLQQRWHTHNLIICFVEWLIEEHDFIDLDIDEFNMEEE